MVVEPGEQTVSVVKEKDSRPAIMRSFYGSALDAAQRSALQHAADIEGLDHEIELLRTKLRDVVEEKPETFKLMLRGMEVLTRLLAVKYRLSKVAQTDLAAHLAAVLRGVSVQLYPEEQHDTGA